MDPYDILNATMQPSSAAGADALNRSMNENDPYHHAAVLQGISQAQGGQPDPANLSPSGRAALYKAASTLAEPNQPQFPGWDQKRLTNVATLAKRYVDSDKARVVANQKAEEVVRSHLAMLAQHPPYKSRPDDPMYTGELANNLRAIPDLEEEDVQAHVGAVKDLGPQWHQGAYLAYRTAQKKQEIDAAGGDRWSEAIGRRLPLVGSIGSIGDSLATKNALERIRDGQGTADDYDFVAKQQARTGYQQSQGLGYQVGNTASHIPGFVGEMYLTGGLSSAAGGGARAALGAAGRGWIGAAIEKGVATGAQAALVPSLTARMTAERMVPEMRTDDKGRLLIGANKSLASELPKGFAEGAVDVALMHGLGNIAGQGTGGLSAYTNSVRGAMSGVAYMRASEVGKYLLSLKDNAGVSGDLASGDPDRFVRGMKQMAGEAGGFAA